MEDIYCQSERSNARSCVRKLLSISGDGHSSRIVGDVLWMLMVFGVGRGFNTFEVSFWERRVEMCWGEFIFHYRWENNRKYE